MLAGLDLTPRQAARVLEQALRGRAQLELEPRNLERYHVIRGRFAGRTGDVLRVELHDHDPAGPLAGLVGAFCDVRTILSGELYMFSTCVVEADETSIPQHLLLAVPQALQVANRRRFERKYPSPTAQVQLSGGALDVPRIGPILSISPTGLACRVVQTELDDLLLIGDDIHVSFTLPGHVQSFELPATVCNKLLARDKTYLDLGLEFHALPQDDQTRRALERLQSALCNPATDNATGTTTDDET